ncbi:hypothetical protein ACHAXT_001508 [Thalassiosira profunda]
MSSIKQESDQPGYSPPPSPNAHAPHAPFATPANAGASAAAATAAPETAVLDEFLAASDFEDRIRLVSAVGSDGKLWPALRFDNMVNLQDAILRDVKAPKGKVAHLRNKILGKLGATEAPNGIVYLLGRGKIKRSFVVLTPQVIEEDFYNFIHAGLQNKDGYKDDEKFKEALALTRFRLSTYDSDEESPVKQEGAKSTETPEANVAGGPEANASSEAEAANDTEDAADDDDDVSATVDLQGNGDTTAANVPSVVNVSGPGEVAGDPLPANGDVRAASTDKKKKKRKGGPKENGGKKSKTANKTPAKARRTRNGKKAKASRVSMSPAPTKNVAMDDDISKMISPVDESYTVITDDEAWKLLKSYYRVTLVDGRYYIPSQERPVATTLAGLRKTLCILGLPPSTSELTVQQRVDIARWVRYANVSGLADGQTITPDDLGKHMNKFMDAWGLLRDNFGCHWSPGKYYTVPSSPEGGRMTFETDGEVQREFAKFGIQCLPDNIPVETLSKKDRLSLELFFATPPLRVVNTFEREVPGAGRRRKKVNYSEN